MKSLKLSIEPQTAMIDVERRITVSGAKPGAAVRISTNTMRDARNWVSSAVFIADADGNVDLSRDAPQSGDYTGCSPMGLIWSQNHADKGMKPLFNQDLSQALVTHITAQCEEAAAEVQMQQDMIAEGVTRQVVRENGLVGVLYRPAGTEPAPAVMILNGSGGGINEPRAALLAAHGYNALALGYFGAEGLPDYISNTPLEYFETGLDWLRNNLLLKDDFIAVIGQSRGGELALLLGSTFPEKISAVIGNVPSAFVHGGQAASDPAIGRDGPCWLYQGKPLTHIWDNNRFASWKPYEEGRPRRNSAAMLTALADPVATAKARIPVEKIAGPVMLISGGDDGAWPADLFSLMIKSSLTASGHPHEVDWYNHPQAGHSILFPYVPSTQIAYEHPVNGHQTTMGGEPKANAEANEQSWAAVIGFLQRAAN